MWVRAVSTNGCGLTFYGNDTKVNYIIYKWVWIAFVWSFNKFGNLQANLDETINILDNSSTTKRIMDVAPPIGRYTGCESLQPRAMNHTSSLFSCICLKKYSTISLFNENVRDFQFSVSQNILNLTKFIKKNNNIYSIKLSTVRYINIIS